MIYNNLYLELLIIMNKIVLMLAIGLLSLNVFAMQEVPILNSDTTLDAWEIGESRRVELGEGKGSLELIRCKALSECDMLAKSKDGKTILSLSVNEAKKRVNIASCYSGERQGVGRLLLETAHQHCVDSKAERIELNSIGGSWPFYFRLGARPSKDYLAIEHAMVVWWMQQNGLLSLEEISLLERYTANFSTPFAGTAKPKGIREEDLEVKGLGIRMIFDWREIKKWNVGDDLPEMVPCIPTRAVFNDKKERIGNEGGNIALAFSSEDIHAWKKARGNNADPRISVLMEIGEEKLKRDITAMHELLKKIDKEIYEGEFQL
jgi:hypothetical protein